MKTVFRTLIDKAVWWRIALAFAATAAGAAYLFSPASVYSRLKAELGGLPEEQMGQHPGATLSAIAKMNDAQASAYLGFQLLDGVYQIFALLFVALVLARAIKSFPAYAERLERVLALPLVLFAVEILENFCLALFGARLTASPVLELAQQSLTTLKLSIGFLLFPLTVAALALAAVDGFRVAIGAKKA